MGIASSKFIGESNGKLPGQITDTIGYHSKNGYMYYNGKYHGNMMGHKCSRGDSMALEMEVFEPDMSVAIFSKNFKPVGTRFLTLKDFNEFLPTFAVQNNGEDFEMNVYWHTVVSMPPHFNVVRNRTIDSKIIFNNFNSAILKIGVILKEQKLILKISHLFFHIIMIIRFAFKPHIAYIIVILF